MFVFVTSVRSLNQSINPSELVLQQNYFKLNSNIERQLSCAKLFTARRKTLLP